MTGFSTERLAPSSRIAEPKPQQGERDTTKPRRRKSLPQRPAHQGEGEPAEPYPTTHQIDRLA